MNCENVPDITDTVSVGGSTFGALSNTVVDSAVLLRIRSPTRVRSVAPPMEDRTMSQSVLALTALPGTDLSYLVLHDEDFEPIEVGLRVAYQTPADVARVDVIRGGWVPLRHPLGGLDEDGQRVTIEFFERGE